MRLLHNAMKVIKTFRGSATALPKSIMQFLKSKHFLLVLLCFLSYCISIFCAACYYICTCIHTELSRFSACCQIKNTCDTYSTYFMPSHRVCEGGSIVFVFICRSAEHWSFDHSEEKIYIFAIT